MGSEFIVLLIVLVLLKNTESFNARPMPRLMGRVGRRIVGTGASVGAMRMEANALGESPVERRRRRKIFGGIKGDIERRWSWYTHDWTDGVNRKTAAAVGFLYFACLAPCIAFGGITNVITHGTIGVVEFLISTGAAGILYSVAAGQPMSFLGPTGLTLAFTASLYNFCSARGLPFLPLYSWTGLWTSFFLALLSIFNYADFIEYCTGFTDDCFNALLSTNFVFQACRSLLRNFTGPGTDLVRAFASLNMALLTFTGTRMVDRIRRTTFFNKKWRNYVADFGPSVVICLMSLLAAHPYIQTLNIQHLSLPKKLALAGGRGWVPDLLSVPLNMRLGASIPAVLLTMLFYLDQNISVRTVNNQPGLERGSAFHLDMLVLSIIVGALSFLGLPWVCGATVQSMNNVRSLSSFRLDEETGQEVVEKVTESRVSGFMVHLGILASLLLLPVLSFIPLPVVSGIFLFIGIKMMKNNVFLERTLDFFRERRKLPADSIYRLLPKRAVGKYVGLQGILLSLVWVLKESPRTSLFFPACIGVMVLMRFFLLPKIFTEKELRVLDPVGF